MTSAVHKVTCFITRQGRLSTELLLFRHPNAGIQIPAGTAEPDEAPEVAARREAAEESGLTGLVLKRLLGEMDEPPPPGQALVAQSTPVYSRPDRHSFDWAHFRNGIQVKVLRQADGFTQVSYEEPDRYPDPQYTTYTITGWVPDEALTHQRKHHFYLFEHHRPTPESWSVATDNHVFSFFWVALEDLPSIIPPQDGWLKWLKDIL